MPCQSYREPLHFVSVAAGRRRNSRGLQGSWASYSMPYQSTPALPDSDLVDISISRANAARRNDHDSHQEFEGTKIHIRRGDPPDGGQGPVPAIVAALVSAPLRLPGWTLRSDYPIR